MTVTQALEARRAVPSFDPSAEISRSEIERLLSAATLTPSSMNLQPWQFLLCHTAEDKARLQEVAMGQKKVAEASAAVVVLGNLLQHRNADRVVESNIRQGYFGEERREGWVQMAHGGWTTERAQRDEAFRAGSLVAMSLMLLAAEAGWDTAPLGGFWPDKLAAEFSLPEHIVPVLIVAIGKRNPTIQLLPRNDRFPVEEILFEGRYGNR